MIRFLFLFFAFIISSCTYNELSPCETNAPAFTDCVKPIFEQSCIGCHFTDNSYGIMPLTNYQEIKDKVINSTVIESLERAEGFMPKSGERLSAEHILIIKNWKENGAPNN